MATRNLAVDVVELPITVHAGRLWDDASKIRPEMIVRHAQNERGRVRDKLRNGAKEYHTGGWVEVPIVGGHQTYAGSFPYAWSLIQSLEADALRARFMGLEPDHEINPHVGNMADIEKFRIHFPAITNEEAKLFVDGREYHLPVGQAWYLNQTRVHWLHNHGKPTRWHLVVDVVPNAWTDQLVTDGVRYP